MNNYIDERFISYKRPKITTNKVLSERKGSPLTRTSHKENILVQCLKVVAVIFLLLLSTLSGDKKRNAQKSEQNIEGIVKSIAIYGGVVLAIWLGLVVVNNIINAAVLLPTWFLILIFALTLLGAAKISNN